MWCKHVVQARVEEALSATFAVQQYRFLSAYLMGGRNPPGIPGSTTDRLWTCHLQKQLLSVGMSVQLLTIHIGVADHCTFDHSQSKVKQ